MKFGGSSVANAERLKNVAELVRSEAPGGVVVVLSALGGVTDALVSCGKTAASRNETLALEELARVMARHRAVAADLFDVEPSEKLGAFIDGAEKELSLLLRGSAMLGALPD